MKRQIAPEPLDQPEWAIRAVLGALGKHLTSGEVGKLQRALPHEVRELWEIGCTKPVLEGCECKSRRDANLSLETNPIFD